MLNENINGTTIPRTIKDIEDINFSEIDRIMRKHIDNIDSFRKQYSIWEAETPEHLKKNKNKEEEITTPKDFFESKIRRTEIMVIALELLLREKNHQKLKEIEMQ
jgi:hypothetical protein